MAVSRVSVLALASLLAPAVAYRDESVGTSGDLSIAKNATAGDTEMCCCPDPDTLIGEAGVSFGFKVQPGVCTWNNLLPKVDGAQGIFGLSLEKRGERQFATIDPAQDIKEDQYVESPALKVDYSSRGNSVVCHYDADSSLRLRHSFCARNTGLNQSFVHYEDRLSLAKAVGIRVAAKPLLKKWYCPRTQCNFDVVLPVDDYTKSFTEDCLDLACQSLGVPCKDHFTELTNDQKMERAQAIETHKITFLVAKTVRHTYVPSVCVGSEAREAGEMELKSGLIWGWSCPANLVECYDRHENLCVEQAKVFGWKRDDLCRARK